MNNIKKTGALIIILSAILFLIEKISVNAISSYFGKLLCGERYLQELNGILLETSCGFNADMYLITFLILFLVIGVVMFTVGFKKV